ncbi:cell division protein FtsL [Hyphococcus sp.]|uniref:cell division protein FtsL n=1 Tax=Hyphococcus sp. TaxID=2038636 RepID=UPI003CCBEF5D
MIRITTIFLCFVLAAAAFGRYKAEVSVRELRKEIDSIETSQVEELRSIQMLRAEIAYLENPERLAKIADMKTTLRPSEGEQLQNAQEFAVAFGLEEAAPGDDEPASDVILNAMAMAQLTEAEKINAR